MAKINISYVKMMVFQGFAQNFPLFLTRGTFQIMHFPRFSVSKLKFKKDILIGKHCTAEKSFLCKRCSSSNNRPTYGPTMLLRKEERLLHIKEFE